MRVGTIPALAAMAFLATFAQGSAPAAELDPPPVWDGDTLLGPARGAATLVKASFVYQSETKKLIFRCELKSVEMQIGSTTAKMNGQTKALPVAPRIINGTAYVPLKNLFGGLGAEVKPAGENQWSLCISTMCVLLKVPPKPE